MRHEQFRKRDKLTHKRMKKYLTSIIMRDI